MKELNGKFGKTIFTDCLPALQQMSDKKWDMCVSDPPYNIDAKKVIGTHPRQHYKETKETQRDIIEYNDLKDSNEYYNWCNQWFQELKRITNFGCFTCGFVNIGYWTWIHKLQYIIWVHKNCPSRAYASMYSWQEPIVCYGKFNRKYPQGVFEVPTNSGFNLRTEEELLNHPHPKPFKLWRKLIELAQPKSVIDIFAGSGTTAEVCEELGIPYLCIELSEEFYDDITTRTNWGIKKHKPKGIVKGLLSNYGNK